MMYLSFPLGQQALSRQALKEDKRGCQKIGPCGLGKKALYVGSRFFSRTWYLPYPEVRRVYKRVAMTRGGYSGKGLFGSIAYLVVEYGQNQEKACAFRYEPELDLLLEKIRERCPLIPTVSAAAEKRLEEKRRKEREKAQRPLSDVARGTIRELQEAKDFLEKREDLSQRLTQAARQKRIVDNLSPGARILGGIFGIGGLGLAIGGLAALWLREPLSTYLLLIGGALFFLSLSSNLFPGRFTSRKVASSGWKEAVGACEKYLSGREDFPVPPCYAHPLVLDWMAREIREGKADDAPGALLAVKERLKSLNASVSVSEEERDEVLQIKPLFLVCGYEDQG